MTVMLHVSRIKKTALKHLEIQLCSITQHWNESVTISPNCYNVIIYHSWQCSHWRRGLNIVPPISQSDCLCQWFLSPGWVEGAILFWLWHCGIFRFHIHPCDIACLSQSVKYSLSCIPSLLAQSMTVCCTSLLVALTSWRVFTFGKHLYVTRTIR